MSSERLLYGVLLQQFMDINMEEAEVPAFDASVFANSQSLFLEGKVSERFLTQVVGLRAARAGEATGTSVDKGTSHTSTGGGTREAKWQLQLERFERPGAR